MREYSEFLTEREIFILEHHPAMTYKAIGQELGISSERVRQLKYHAERMIREEKRREQAAARGQLPIMVILRRKDLWIVIRALKNYSHHLVIKSADLRRKQEPDLKEDPDIQIAENLIHSFLQILNSN